MPLTKLLGRILLMCLGLRASMAAAQAGPPLERLQRKLAILRHERAKAQGDFLTKPQLEQALDMRNFGLQTLQELEVRKALVSGLGAVEESSRVGDQSKVLLEWRGRSNARDLKDLNEAYEICQKAAEAYKSGGSQPKEVTDRYIAILEAMNGAQSLAGSYRAPEAAQSFSENQSVKGVSAIGLTALYSLRASQSEGDERLKFQMKALSEASKYTAEVGMRLANSNPETKALVKLAQVDGEILTRLSVFGVAGYQAHHMESQAEALKANTLGELDRMLTITEIEIDKAVRLRKIAEHRAAQREPGGIKFNGYAAEGLARQLEVTAVHYDPARGRLILSGKKSEQVFDAEVFADVLRLAAERYDPWFSLDSSNPPDWDEEVNREGKQLRQRYPDPRAIGARVRSRCPQPIEHGGRNYYYTTMEVFDPDLVAAANRGKDVTTRVVFSPEWLRDSPVGWMLYDADLAIKSIASGFLETTGGVTPSPAWQLADFNPDWLRPKGHPAGRANFEIDASGVGADQDGVDLEEVHPRLYVTDRKTGTDQDLPPSPQCLAISEHFQRHWRDYTRSTPALSRLQMLYRSYVAARMIVHRYPGLADRISRFPRQPNLHLEAPLLIVQPTVLCVCYQGGQMVPLDGGVYYHLGGGYGGGVSLKAPQAGPPRAAAAASRWAVDPLRGEAAPYLERGDERAIGLDVSGEKLPDSRAWLWMAAVSAGLTVSGLASRGLGWQRLQTPQVCAHCVRLHRRLGPFTLMADTLALGSLLTVAALPVAAALAEEPGPGHYLAAVGLLLGLLAGLRLLGALLAWRGRRSGPADVLAGARLLGLVTALTLLWGGVLPDRIGERLQGQWSLPLLLLLLFSSLLGMVLGQLAPRLWGSRPLGGLAGPCAKEPA